MAAGIVLMPGARGVFPTLTVEENLRLAAWLFRKDTEYVKQATEQVLEYFPVLRDRWTQKAGNLSGGEQQMLTLSQVFLARPTLLMIDELSLGLAPLIVERLLEIVRAIHRNGTAIVLVEQSVNIAITLAERAVFLEKGEVRFQGPTSALLNRPDLLRAVFLSDKGRRSSALAAVTKEPFVARCETCGREHGLALSTHELGVSFGGIRAVDDVVVRHPRASDPRDHRAERRRQDDGVRHDLRVRAADVGCDQARRRRRHRKVSGRARRARSRTVLPGRPALPGDDRPAGDRDCARPSRARTRSDRCVRHVACGALVRARGRREGRSSSSTLLNLEAFADKFVGELSTGTRRIVDLACSLAHDPNGAAA